MDEGKEERIQTFVFMDLEATGLHDRPRIVELCMLAVSREHLLGMEGTATPRTTNATAQLNSDPKPISDSTFSSPKSQCQPAQLNGEPKTVGNMNFSSPKSQCQSATISNTVFGTAQLNSGPKTVPDMTYSNPKSQAQPTTTGSVTNPNENTDAIDNFQVDPAIHNTPEKSKPLYSFPKTPRSMQTQRNGPKPTYTFPKAPPSARNLLSSPKRLMGPGNLLSLQTFSNAPSPSQTTSNDSTATHALSNAFLSTLIKPSPLQTQRNELKPTQTLPNGPNSISNTPTRIQTPPNRSNSIPNSPTRTQTLPNRSNSIPNTPTRTQSLPSRPSTIPNSPKSFPNTPTPTQTPPNTPNTLSNSPVQAQTTPTKPKPLPVLPRVLHRYTRLYYPWKLLPPFVERINGLNNGLLEHLPGFTESSAEAVKLFLDLPKPVAIVAHNGKRYDFPLLMAELTRVGKAEDFGGLKCCDSLLAVKEMDVLIEQDEVNQMTKLAEDFFDDVDFFDDLIGLDDDSQQTKRLKSVNTEHSLSVNLPSTQTQTTGDKTTSSNWPNTRNPGVTTPKQNLKPTQPSTPSKPTTPASPYTPKQPRTPGTPTMASKLNSDPKVRRNLSQEYGKRKVSPRVSYTQESIYKRLFASSYSSHRAECDAEALLLICSHYGRWFVDWADSCAVNLTSVAPMWLKKNSN